MNICKNNLMKTFVFFILLKLLKHRTLLFDIFDQFINFCYLLQNLISIIMR